MDENAMAAKLFGNTMAQQDQQAAPEPAPEEAVAARLYAEQPDNSEAHLKSLDMLPPDEVKAARDADTARRLFGNGGLDNNAVKAINLATDILDPEVPEEMRNSLAQEWGNIAADLELNSRDIIWFAELTATEFPTMTEEKRAGWESAAIKRMGEVFGNEADHALNQARALVARDARLFSLLDSTGMGSHPEVVVMLARQARSLKQSRGI